MKITLYSSTDVYYYSFYIEGFYKLYGKKNVSFSCKQFPKFPERTFAAIIKDGNYQRKIIIDAFDSDKIAPEQLKWCDAYGKVNLNREILKGEEKEKVVAIGPSFGIKIWNIFETINLALRNYRRSRKQIYLKRDFSANYWRQNKRQPLKYYLKETKPASINSFVFFLGSLWAKEERTNHSRATFIEVCKCLEEIKFEGGFAPRSDGKDFGFSELIYQRISLKEYLQKVKKSFVVFNTPAVQDCHGWKLGEFLALGKAIISTSFFNVLPTPLIHKKYIHYVDDSKQSIVTALKEILQNPDYRESLETNAQHYFKNNLLPELVVEKLIEHSIQSREYAY